MPVLSAAVVLVALNASGGGSVDPAICDGPRWIGSEPQLFLDDVVIEKTEGLVKTIHHPVRLDQPILDSEKFGTWQPYLTVLHDARTKRFRLWYNGRPALRYCESSDGIHWEEFRDLNIAPRYCCSLVDDEGRERDPSRRFKMLYWQQDPGPPRGLFAAFSPDGLTWTEHPGNPVLRGYPDDPAGIRRHLVGDIVDAFYDPIHKRYAAALKLPCVPDDGFAPAPKAGGMFRRLVGMSWSTDFVGWSRPWRIFLPDGKDEGLLEFYGMAGVHLRGSLYIGFVRALRDDLPCDEGGPKDGIGYATLAISRDAENWQRFREPFLDRNPRRGSWDHAMTWISAIVPVGDEVYLYYGGYARGHKIEPRRERQIGLAKLRKDGYLSLRAGDKPGSLLTRTLTFVGGTLCVNAEVAGGGELRVEIQDDRGRPLPGFVLADCDPIKGKEVAHRVTWKGKSDVADLAGKVIRLKFVLRSVDLYAFEFVGGVHD